MIGGFTCWGLSWSPSTLHIDPDQGHRNVDTYMEDEESFLPLEELNIKHRTIKRKASAISADTPSLSECKTPPDLETFLAQGGRAEKQAKPPVYTGTEDTIDAKEFDLSNLGISVPSEMVNSLSPMVDISLEKYKILFKLWRKTLILKVLSKRFNYKVIEQRTKDLWKLEWDCELVDLEDGYYLARFCSVKDCTHILEGGPWIILGRYLTISKWRPNFSPVDNTISSTLVWVRFSGLPLELFDKVLLVDPLKWMRPPCLQLGGNQKGWNMTGYTLYALNTVSMGTELKLVKNSTKCSNPCIYIESFKPERGTKKTIEITSQHLRTIDDRTERKQNQEKSHTNKTPKGQTAARKMSIQGNPTTLDAECHSTIKAGPGTPKNMGQVRVNNKHTVGQSKFSILQDVPKEPDWANSVESLKKTLQAIPGPNEVSFAS
ncbi:hypothetical protein M9H77_24148 [Catharanthus roseus]|uniref:Uncharacterized protein n=1 Tax=Catharanthus roseus TaxID=4058 RepID=A0ACC0AVA9_CATRO|nr:hypothetical protein M9H77_24148 [Catharanthus roseus]